MKKSTESIESVKIVYKRSIGPYGESNYRAMDDFKIWCNKYDLLNTDSIIYGIIHDDPNYTEPSRCRYDTCLVISDNYKLDEKSIQEGITHGSLTGGRYMVFEIEHTSEEVEKAWTNMFEELASAEVILDVSRPIAERYKTQLLKNHKCEICVPII